MQQLIAQVREAIPFDLTDEQICADSCQGCSVKLLAFLEQELETWEHRLAAGEQPNLADLAKLAKTSKRIYQVLEQNGLLKTKSSYQ